VLLMAKAIVGVLVTAVAATGDDAAQQLLKPGLAVLNGTVRRTPFPSPPVRQGDDGISAMLRWFWYSVAPMRVLVPSVVSAGLAS